MVGRNGPDMVWRKYPTTYDISQNAVVGVSSARQKEREHGLSLSFRAAQNEAFFHDLHVVCAEIHLGKESLDGVDVLTRKKDGRHVVGIVFAGFKFLVE